MAARSVRDEVRLAELLGVLSLVGDLGMGQSMEHALRQCLVAMRLAERMAMAEAERRAVYYSGLMVWVGCHVDSYEQARWFGDEMAFKADNRTVDFASPAQAMTFVMGHVGRGRPPLERVRTGVELVATGMGDVEAMLENHWRAAEDMAIRFGLDADVRKSIEQCFERWDGKGSPDGAKGDDIALPSRLVSLADVVVYHHRIGGIEAAVAVAKERSGTQFDPAVVDVFCAHAEAVLAGLDEATTWDAVVRAEPGASRPLTDDELDAALEAIADFTDVKSPYTLGHSRRVADLGGAAADGLGLPEARAVRRAGLLHDIGRLGVSNTIWDKEGALSLAESERVRLHPYLTERTLASSPGLAALGAIAIQHHERLDGSGYPRGLKADALTMPGRVLAAADMYQAKREDRPHRPASSASEASSILRSEVKAGRLDPDAAEAVLRAAGHAPRRRKDNVAGLTSREVEVLRLLAKGRSTKQIAAELGIARKTAANHLEHVYAKLGVTNRALASLAASRHGLVDPED